MLSYLELVSPCNYHDFAGLAFGTPVSKPNRCQTSRVEIGDAIEEATVSLHWSGKCVDTRVSGFVQWFHGRLAGRTAAKMCVCVCVCVALSVRTCMRSCVHVCLCGCVCVRAYLCAKVSACVCFYLRRISFVDLRLCCFFKCIYSSHWQIFAGCAPFVKPGDYVIS